MEAARYGHRDVTEFSTAVFTALGLPEDDARTIAADLVEADLRGLASHGVARIPIYSRRLREGIVNPRPDIKVEAVTPVAALVDGDDGMGFIVSHRAMDEAIKIAEAFGIGLVAVKRSTHFGMAALYVKQAMDAGFIGLTFTTSSPALPAWGGRSVFLGAAPLAVGAPGETGPGYLLDMAMTVIARGKIRLAAQRGEPIPEGLALDAEGNPTTDAKKAFEGVCLPMGGPKGSALSMMMDVLAGVFTGSAFGGEVRSLYFDFAAPQDVGHLMIAIKPGLFVGDQFGPRMDELAERVKALPRAAGVDEIMMPGEPEDRRAEQNRIHGLAITDDVIAQLREEADRFGLPFFA